MDRKGIGNTPVCQLTARKFSFSFPLNLSSSADYENLSAPNAWKGEDMKKLAVLLTVVAAGVLLAGCATNPSKTINGIELGMTPKKVLDKMGEPTVKRAAKVYENGQWTQVWEYTSPLLSMNPKTFWLYFENDKLVQWGQPGDFSGKSGANVPVTEYSDQKMIK
ncbi:MAG TPA: hypothetical protein PKM67_01315 [Kiritimatiellia bacterium]|jgi:hypothetical protein|nr:hypothetical protein [Kiritimatiellia bacterium]HNS80081.1 hypothetical protein [Kiritimatiellia bacterium]HPA77891.1 hypothetical protein [Kiritimatiellia bacterium]HQQ03940.1 hypothetical protein [Kiritimatiellia bacterium]HRY15641.1 hypothetical protein [Candidatus Competibacteraceae bacterium]